jgi:hypothetical protein
MNPEIIKIAIENKAFLDALKLQIPNQQITTAPPPIKSLNSGGLWKIVFVAGITIIGYTVYSYYNNKKQLKNL